MDLFLQLFKRLLPRALAWTITLEIQLRQFFEGLSISPSDARDFFDDRFDDLYPQTTTQLDEWEDQFGLFSTLTVDQDRRDRLDAVWAALGGQSPKYLQDTVQARFPNVYIHEFWSARATPSDAAPTIRDPIADAGMTDGPNYDFECTAAGTDECTAAGTVECGLVSSPTGYILVNKGNGVNYRVPVDPTTFPYILYWGAQTFPNLATVDADRREEFENLLLSICPGQQWLGVLVEYS